MVTAVDSSALLCILRGEKDAEVFVKLLIKNAAIGTLVICDVVAAEVGGFFKSPDEFGECMQKLSLTFDPISLSTAHSAGLIFQRYRANGGARTTLVPDFLIGAHAMKQADQLVATDRGYLKKYFDKLKLIGVDRL